jgi:hypothetical protein
MPLVSVPIDNLINGVSQQAQTQRLPSQCEIKENSYETVAEGCEKRPPTVHLKVLDQLNLGHASNVSINWLDLGADGRYIVSIANGTMRVFDNADGTEKTLSYTPGTYGSYLTLVSPATINQETFKLVHVGDYALLLNSSVLTGTMDIAAGPQTTGDTFLVHVREGGYGTTYKIVVTLGSITYTASKTTSDTSLSDIRTTNIAADLRAGFSPALPSAVQCVRSSNESVLSFTYTPPDGGPVYSDFKVQVSDSNGSSDMTIVRDVVQRFSDLPTVVPTNFNIVKVIGENASLSNPYYVQFIPDTTTQSFGKGTWIECAAALGTHSNSLNAQKMPHKLVRNSDGTFTLSTAAWGDRTAGDPSRGSAPFPSFITGTGAFAAGRAIQDLFVYKGRLGFISRDAVIFSRFDQFLELFPATVVTLLDTGPIDFTVRAEHTPVLRSAIPYNGDLLLLADHDQFRVDGTQLLTPKTPSADRVTSFTVSPTVKPVLVGNSVYFPFSRGTFTGLNEFFIDTVNGTSDAADITAHVPQYIPGDLCIIAASHSHDFLVMGSKTDKSQLFVYKFYWSGDQKLQSSWSAWNCADADDTILGVKCYDTDIYLIIQRDAGGVHLEKISLDLGATDPGASFVTLLDRKISSAGLPVSYDVLNNLTTWTLPYKPSSDLRIAVRTSSGAYRLGQRILVASVSGFTVSCANDLSAIPLWFGVPFSQLIRLSHPYPRNPKDGTADTKGRFQLRRLSLRYEDTGYFRIEVTPDLRSTTTKVFNATTLGGDPELGSVPIDSGQFSVYVQSRNDRCTVDIVNDSHLPSRFVSAVWDGELSPLRS